MRTTKRLNSANNKMKLLPQKSDIEKSKQIERKFQIDQGVELAKNIDDMRELRAREETSLKQWRKQTIAAIQIEINQKNLEKESLNDDIAALREVRQSLLEPLNAEWKELNQAEETLEKRKLLLIQEKNEFHKKEKELDKREKTIENIEKNLRERTLEIINKESQLEHGSI